VFDPANTVRKTVNDVENSGIVVGGDSVPGAPVRVSFQHKNAGAKTVHLAGEFNGWLDPDNGKVSGKAEWLMKSESDGRWTFSTMLLPGKYQYKFVINGGEVWEKDAHAPSTDEDNSLIEVKSGTTPAAAATPSAPASLAAGAAAARFTLVDSAAKSVYVAGEFNNWSATANPMKKDTFGIWGAEISLKPGKYQYKFVVDGEWRLDPNAVETAEDGDGNKNSVKVVK
jgi:1,4-alpha-glucan branching enzyme